ncbi:hypothetical protein HC256_003877 [Beauveria bassiana]|nr:hypothetical protein HC256_003877 [Beauveria bassiana]
MFLQQDDKDMARYHDASHSVAFTSAPMDMNIAAEAYSAYAGSLATTMGSLEQTMYGTDSGVPNYVLNNRTSPSVYPDDGDMRLSSSGLSTASAPSAPSSVVGSPQSHTGHLGVPEWASMQPGIVGDYMTGGEYPTFSSSNVDDLSTFDFTHAKTFVARNCTDQAPAAVVVVSAQMWHRGSERLACVMSVYLACIAEPQDPLAPGQFSWPLAQPAPQFLCSIEPG